MFMRKYPGDAWKILGPCMYRSDGRVNRSPQAEFLMQMFLDECRSERCAPLEELAQNGVDPGLGLSGGQFQDPKIVLGGARGSVYAKRRSPGETGSSGTSRPGGDKSRRPPLYAQTIQSGDDS
jgi:hypothetical protein